MVGFSIIWISVLLGLSGSWIMSRYAIKFGMVDTPVNRSSHTLPTPRGGGIGIVVAFIVCALSTGVPLLFWLSALFLSLAGFFDDKLGLSPRTRLIFQFITAGTVALAIITGPGSVNAYIAGIGDRAITFAPFIMLFFISTFIVGTANFYNFMDGINGMAGITGMVAFGLLALFAHMNGENALALTAAGVAAACLGFLPMNFPQARVFMGDVGSLLLGFVFATLCVALTRSSVDFLVLCGFLSTFYADALTTLFIRWRNGERLFQAHRRHVYQLLANQLHIPHAQVSLGYGTVQLVIGCLLIWLSQWGALPVAVSECLIGFCWWQMMKFVRRLTENSV